MVEREGVLAALAAGLGEGVGEGEGEGVHGVSEEVEGGMVESNEGESQGGRVRVRAEEENVKMVVARLLWAFRRDGVEEGQEEGGDVDSRGRVEFVQGLEDLARRLRLQV